MELKAGSRWRSAVDEVEVVVVRPPAQPVQLECGGAAMVPQGDEPPAGVTIAADWSGGTALGKRFVHEASNLEVLAVKGGTGTLAVGGEALELKGAKPLPASD
ncbi:MAG: hypothetical protein JWN46_3297 [Acidimicrobiales bacterium]|nr:hypothetical protein [Acidimicrobiales bacterium]